MVPRAVLSWLCLAVVWVAPAAGGTPLWVPYYGAARNGGQAATTAAVLPIKVAWDFVVNGSQQADKVSWVPTQLSGARGNLASSRQGVLLICRISVSKATWKRNRMRRRQLSRSALQVSRTCFLT